MENLMMLTCSRKTNKRIISIILTVCFALVIVFCPIAQTVAYANVVNQCFEVVGFIVGAVAGGWATSACLAAAGITSAAIFTSTVQALIIFLAAMGVGIAVSTIVHILTSEETLDAFGVEFWKALSNAWDQTTNRIKIAAGTFLFLYNRVKSVFNIKDSHVNKFTTFPYETSTEEPTGVFFASSHPCVQESHGVITHSDGTTEPCTHEFIRGNNLLEDSKKCANCGKVQNNNSVMIENLCSISLDGKIVTIKFLNDNTINFRIMTDHPTAFSRVLCYPVVYQNGLYFCLREHHIIDYNDINHDVKINGLTIACVSSGHTYSRVNGVYTYYYILFDDGFIETAKSTAEFLYKVLVLGGSIVSCSQKLNVTSTSDVTDSLKQKINVLGSIDGSIPKDSDITTYKPMNKDITYNTKANDTAKTVVGKLTGVDVKSGDVVIDANEVKDIAIDDSTDIADSLTVTDVAAQDIVTDDTITDTDTPSSSLTDILTAPFVPWSTSIDLIKNASSGITERFPFCIPGYLKDQLNILVCEPKEPIFVIPFRIESADLGGDVKIDLTRFSSMTKITDFFLIAMLIVGLALSTKKLMF